MSIQIELNVEGTTAQFKEEASVDPKKAGGKLKAEIQEFESHFVGQGLDPLTRYESQILMEYLGYKIMRSEEPSA